MSSNNKNAIHIPNQPQSLAPTQSRYQTLNIQQNPQYQYNTGAIISGNQSGSDSFHIIPSITSAFQMQSGGTIQQGGVRGIPSSSTTALQDMKITAQSHPPPIMNPNPVYRHATNNFRNGNSNQPARNNRPIVQNMYHSPVYVPGYQGLPYNRLANPSHWNTQYSTLHVQNHPYPAQAYYITPNSLMQNQHQHHSRIRGNSNDNGNLINLNNLNIPTVCGNASNSNISALASHHQMAPPQPQQATQLTISSDLLTLQQIQHQISPQNSTQQAVEQSQPNHSANSVTISTVHPNILQQLHLQHQQSTKPAYRKKRGKFAIPIVNPDTKEDITEKLFEDSSTLYDVPSNLKMVPVALSIEKMPTTEYAEYSQDFTIDFRTNRSTVLHSAQQNEHTRTNSMTVKFNETRDPQPIDIASKRADTAILPRASDIHQHEQATAATSVTPIVSAITDSPSFEIRANIYKTKKTIHQEQMLLPKSSISNMSTKLLQPHCRKVEVPDTKEANTIEDGKQCGTSENIDALSNNLGCALHEVTANKINLEEKITKDVVIVSEKSISESKLSTDAEPFIFFGCSDNNNLSSLSTSSAFKEMKLETNVKKECSLTKEALEIKNGSTDNSAKTAKPTNIDSNNVIIDSCTTSNIFFNEIDAIPTNIDKLNECSSVENSLIDMHEKKILVNSQNMNQSLLDFDSKKERKNIQKLNKSKSIILLVYDADQWSPNNPSGKKKYSREQLIQLKHTVASKEKPTSVLNNLLNILSKSNSIGSHFNNNKIYQNEISLMPKFMTTGGCLNMGQSRPTYSKRSSQGNGNQFSLCLSKQSQSGLTKTGSKIIKMNLLLNEDVKLNESPNAWRPKHLQQPHNINDAEKVTLVLFKKFRSVLNKLTPENFSKLVQEVKNYTIDTEDRLDGCIKLVFEKAISEPNFSEAYAKMCKEIGTLAVETGHRKFHFKGRLLSQCQMEFEKHRIDQTGQIWRNKTILEENKNLESDKLNELKIQLDEEQMKIRRRAVGTVRFIGELYKHGQLTSGIMHTCVNLLIENDQYDEETLECLCKLLTTIGSKMEKEGAQNLNNYFRKLNEIISRKNQSKISSRIRFMIQDVIDLRKDNWQPRRNDLNPRTMTQIAKEAESEQHQINMLNYQPRNTKDSIIAACEINRAGRSSHNILKIMTGSSSMSTQYVQNFARNMQGAIKLRPATDDDGFQQISNNRNNRTLPIDPKKINIMSYIDVTSLGKAANYQGWSNNLFAPLNDESILMSSSQLSSKDRASSHIQNFDAKDTHNYTKDTTECESYKNCTSKNGENYERSQPSDTENDCVYNEISTNKLRRSESLTMSSRDLQLSQKPNLTYQAPCQSGLIIANAQAFSKEDREEHSPAALCAFIEPDDTAKAQIRDFLKNIETFLVENDVDFVLTYLKKIKQQYYWAAIRELLKENLERNKKHRLGVVEIVCEAFLTNLIVKNEFLHGLENIFADAEDIMIDLPHIWKYIATYFVKLLHNRYITLIDLSSSIAAIGNKLKCDFFKELIVEYEECYGTKEAQALWTDSSLQSYDFFTKDSSNDLLHSSTIRCLEKQEQLQVDTINSEILSNKIKEFILSNSELDDIFDWISKKVGKTVNSNEFIRILTTSLLEICIVDTQGYKLKIELLQKYHPIMQKYIDSKSDRELQALYAIQRLLVRLEHPPGLLASIFDNFYDLDVIMDGFMKWKDSNDPIEQEGKGVCLKSTTSFFTMYLENNTDNSADEAT